MLKNINNNSCKTFVTFKIKSYFCNPKKQTEGNKPEG